MNIIDTHCHLDLDIFNSDRDQIIINCKSIGLNKIIVPAISSKSWNKLIEVCDSFEQLIPALGLHPVFINDHLDTDIDLLSYYVEKFNPVAIGEIGLDFYIKDPEKGKQLDFFEKQLLIAEAFKLPVILHVRKAHDEVLNCLSNRNLTGGSCHAFNGSLQQAKKYIDLGFKLGFGGTLTYPNARKIHELAKQIPLESILLETDAPDMSGYNHKGTRNQPEYIIDALNALAEIKKKDINIIAEQTTQNARELFNI